jgi:hypothetical protein
MKTKRMFLGLFVAFTFLFLSCGRIHDKGAYQEGTQSYSFADFTKIDMGNGFKITLLQSSAFSISARGDVRNLNDLYVRVENGVLKADYRPYTGTRRYKTEFTIVMPTLEGVTFSGGVTATITGFSGANLTYFRLSGGSVGNANLQTNEASIDLSGGSRLTLSGNATQISGELSGGSVLESFALLVTHCNLSLSGGSQAKLNVSNTLNITASGGSTARYMGTPTIVSNLSGGSQLIKE